MAQISKSFQEEEEEQEQEVTRISALAEAELMHAITDDNYF